MDDVEIPEGLDKDSVPPQVIMNIDQKKLEKFKTGIVLKSKREKLLEEEQEKKKKDEDEAAALYEDFVAQFSGSTPAGSKTFVRGETIVQGGTGTDILKKSSAKTYTPTPRSGPPQQHTPVAMKPQSTVGKKEKKVKGIDAFLEELKREQQERDERQKRRAQGERIASPPRGESTPQSQRHGSHVTTGDMDTTNLYMGNLSPQCNEQTLLDIFWRYGPIMSVKIMWPYSEEERRRNRNCGFISFFHRRDAADCFKDMQGRMVMGYEMKLSWAKPMPKEKLKPPPQQYQQRQEDFLENAPTQEQQAAALPPNVPRILVSIPPDPETKATIDKLARYVATQGQEFERVVVGREQSNPKFRFLFENGSPQNSYYRWRLFSFAHGDTDEVWQVTPFQMMAGGPMWIPPSIPKSVTTKKRRRSRSRSPSPRHRPRRDRSDNRNERDSSRKGCLGRDEREELHAMLMGLSLENASVQDGMGFALEHADASQDIVRMIIEAVTAPNTPIPKKIARLYLISDILYNSSAPVRNASSYRNLFEPHIQKVFASFNEIYKNLGRMTGEALRSYVMGVVSVWEEWSLYPPALLKSLGAVFVGGIQALDAATAQESAQVGIDEDVDGVEVSLDDMPDFL